MIDIHSSAWDALTLIGIANRMLSKYILTDNNPKLSEVNVHLSDAYMELMVIVYGGANDNESASESGKSDS